MAQVANGPGGAKALLSNAHCQIATFGLSEAMTYLVRDAGGDLLLFVHQGSGELFCDFGHMSYRDGDYILLPRGTMWRLEPDARSVMLEIEATNSAFRLPERGILGPHAIFDPAALETPKIDDAFPGPGDRERVEGDREAAQCRLYHHLSVQSAGRGGLEGQPLGREAQLARHPSGDEPSLSYSAQRAFDLRGGSLCCLHLRSASIESDPGALKVPFFHSNDDFDEVIFYHAGEFFSRDNIRPGMVTWHPNGFTHGPHPKAFAAGAKAAKTMTDEVAVMIDARDPLDMAAAAEATEDRGYADSWKTK